MKCPKCRKILRAPDECHLCIPSLDYFQQIMDTDCPPIDSPEARLIILLINRVNDLERALYKRQVLR